MKNEKGRMRRAGDFLAGKGFYVVLFVCIAVIGVSAWILLFTGNEPDAATVNDSGQSAMDYTPDMFVDDVWGTDDTEDTFLNKRKTSPSPEVSTSPEITPPEVSPSPTPRTQTSETPQTPSEAPKAEGTVTNTKTLADIIYAWPVAGEIERGFAVDALIFNRTMADWRTHPGLDIAAAVGTKVQAIADGTVVNVYYDDLMGTTVIIDHGCDLRSVYWNLAGKPVVEQGDRVTLGAVIGAVGDTAIGEIGEPAHLHLEMTLEGDAVNPAAYLPTR